jgi:HK97 family phage portal protein
MPPVVVGADGRVHVQSNGADAIALAPNADGTQRVISYGDLYQGQPIVFALVNKLARHISTLPLKVYRRRPDGERERVTDPDHPLVRLLHRPTDRYSAVHLKQWLAMPLLVHGNAVIAKFRGNGPTEPPTELLPMDWRYLSAYAPRGGPIEAWVTHETDEWRALPATETIHAAWIATGQRDLGVSPLQALGTTIRLDDAARRYQTSNFQNASRPGGFITLPQDVTLSPEDKQALRAGVEAMHKGVDNHFRIALLTGGAQWQAASFTAQEAELIQTRMISREEACIAYDVAPPVIGDLTHGTYSNVDAARQEFYRTTLRPWLTMLEETLHAHLIAPEAQWDGLFVEFDMAEQLKGSPLEQAQALKLEVESGGLTLNERRQIMNRAPVEGDNADQLLVPVNNLAPADGIQPDGGQADGQ